MQTTFSELQRQATEIAVSEPVIRTCVHCGFCTATCPTYLVLGDELDSPRGRIYLMKNMLEKGGDPGPDVVKHIDRCLSCLACMTTCPSGVDYMRLVDTARAYINEHHKRKPVDRLLRWVLTLVLPHPARFRIALVAARIGRPFGPVFAKVGLKQVQAMLALAPGRLPKRDRATPIIASPKKGRVAILEGCAQPVLRPATNAATRRLLGRLGYEVVAPPRAGCCGALTHHLGKEKSALAFARANVDAWHAEVEKGLEAIIITASGCGTTIKDYGFMLRDDPAYAERAAKVASLAKDITEFLETRDLGTPVNQPAAIVAYHSACSMQHGQKITQAPKKLLAKAGFTVRDVPEGHICCGSAGTYNILQPEIANQLRDRKVANIGIVSPDLIATGNIGCITQLSGPAPAPVLHTIELLDWAYGGPRPDHLPADWAPKPKREPARVIRQVAAAGM